MIVSPLTLDERLRRAQREGRRFAEDMKNEVTRNPYRVIVDCVVSCTVTRNKANSDSQPCQPEGEMHPSFIRSKPFIRRRKPQTEEPKTVPLGEGVMAAIDQWGVMLKAIKEHDLELVIRRRTEEQKEEEWQVRGLPLNVPTHRPSFLPTKRERDSALAHQGGQGRA